jgi:hypothetical protein
MWRVLILYINRELTIFKVVQTWPQNQLRVFLHLKLLLETGLQECVREKSWIFHCLTKSDIRPELTKQLSLMISRNVFLVQRNIECLLEAKWDRQEATKACFRRLSENSNQIRSLHVDDADVEKEIINPLDWDRYLFEDWFERRNREISETFCVAT